MPPELPPPLRTDVAGIGVFPARAAGNRSGSRADRVPRPVDLIPVAPPATGARRHFENGGELAWVTRVRSAGTGRGRVECCGSGGLPCHGLPGNATSGDMGLRRPGDDLVPVRQPWRGGGGRPGGGPGEPVGVPADPGGDPERLAASLLIRLVPACPAAARRDLRTGPVAPDWGADPQVEGDRAPASRRQRRRPGCQ